jgi:hypothetical protein
MSGRSASIAIRRSPVQTGMAAKSHDVPVATDEKTTFTKLRRCLALSAVVRRAHNSTGLQRNAGELEQEFTTKRPWLGSGPRATA